MAKPVKLSRAELQVINDNYKKSLQEIAEILERKPESIAAIVDEIRGKKEAEEQANFVPATASDLMDRVYRDDGDGNKNPVAVVATAAASQMADEQLKMMKRKKVNLPHIHYIKKK